MEASFINTVAIPLWEDLVRIFPDLAPAVARMTSNSDLYQAIAQLPPARIAQVSPVTCTGAGRLNSRYEWGTVCP